MCAYKRGETFSEKISTHMHSQETGPHFLPCCRQPRRLAHTHLYSPLCHVEFGLAWTPYGAGPAWHFCPFYAHMLVLGSRYWGRRRGTLEGRTQEGDFKHLRIFWRRMGLRADRPAGRRAAGKRAHIAHLWLLLGQGWHFSSYHENWWSNIKYRLTQRR